MATTVNPTPEPNPTPAVTPTPKLSASVLALLDAQIKVTRKFESMVEQISADRASLNYNRDQCRLVLQTAFKSAYESLAKQAKLTDADAKAFTDTGMKKSGPDMSKALTLAFPKDDAAAAELEKAEAAGLGINAKLEISRGNTTVANVIAERENKAKGATTETARPPSGATPNQKQPPTPESPAVSKLTPKERYVTQVIALVAFGKSLGLTLEEMTDLTDDTLADMATEATEATEPTESK